MEQKWTKIAVYEYEHNNGDQIWSDYTTFYRNEEDKKAGSYKKIYEEGYYGSKNESLVSEENVIFEMNKIKEKIKKQKDIRGGYKILLDLQCMPITSGHTFHKVNIMEFWFYEWLIKEKGITMEQYGLMKEEMYLHYEKEFMKMYDSIK